MRFILLFIIASSICFSCAENIEIVDHPIVFDEERKILTRAYLADRYGIYQDEPTIIPKMVVVHWTAIDNVEASYRAFEKSHLPGSRKEIQKASTLNVSSHYLIDRDGTIHQLMPDTIMARHVIGLNHCAIGIENVGNKDTHPLTDAQLQSNTWLIEKLYKKYNIKHVIGHYEYLDFIGHPLWKERDASYRTEKIDPGKSFMADLREKISHLDISGSPRLPSTISEDEDTFISLLEGIYPQVKENTIREKRFPQKVILPIIEELKSNDRFTISEVGRSLEGRPIQLISIGSGEISILLWTQMHGDESTATMAIMDILNMLNNEPDPYLDEILENVTLHFIPMLNPDGAEIFQRRNAADVDLNRDALLLQHPETMTLKNVRDSLKADWGFNLHDQSPYYGVGNSPFTASISYLAPAYNYEKDVNDVREKSIKLIGKMNEVMQQYIPNQVGRYNDSFEPRAFGDNMQKWGTSTILIESGGLKNDPEKQELRRLHFISIMHAIYSITHGTYEETSHDYYNWIPYNKSNAFHQVLINNVSINTLGTEQVMDIAIRIRGNLEEDRYYTQAYISDIGDLSTSYAYEIIDASPYNVTVGKPLRSSVVRNLAALKKLNFGNLAQRGITDIYVTRKILAQASEISDFNILPMVKDHPEINLGQSPSIVFWKNGIVHHVVVNGKLTSFQ